MNKIPFCLPLIDNDVIQEVNDVLTGTGWLTTGPKVKSLEEEIIKYCEVPAALCVNSWVSGAMLILRWFGVEAGDEVIIPAYTYSATALSIMNIGAKPIMVDVGNDFNIDVKKIKMAITKKTKAIIPVDIGGYPCDYDAIKTVLEHSSVKSKFTAKTDVQKQLGRVLILADAAHSIGATYKGVKSGNNADITIFSLHSVKNITSGEGGAICINLPLPFDNHDVYTFLKISSLNGQTKTAFEKNILGSWRYDIVVQGMKVNMPDICAAIALAQIRKYEKELLPERLGIFERYNNAFKKYEWAILPPHKTKDRSTSGHLYLLRIAGISEAIRDKIIERIFKEGVSVNVHYIPMPMLTLFKNKGYDIKKYPKTYENYACEISLPIYNGLSEEKITYIIKSVITAVEETIKTL
jgi:dTDP-4-amino-4,6-dideoxygalactose transaminase